MPGPISDSYQGTPDDAPYVPGFLYSRGPKVCPCFHHEGFHGSAGLLCIHARSCGCTGLPPECETPIEEM